jgi:hypothetical protein
MNKKISNIKWSAKGRIQKYGKINKRTNYIHFTKLFDLQCLKTPVIFTKNKGPGIPQVVKLEACNHFRRKENDVRLECSGYNFDRFSVLGENVGL